ncbi:hypothetical protein SLA2020_163270 [Shorea laevis]
MCFVLRRRQGIIQQCIHGHKVLSRSIKRTRKRLTYNIMLAAASYPRSSLLKILYNIQTGILKWMIQNHRSSLLRFHLQGSKTTFLSNVEKVIFLSTL